MKAKIIHLLRANNLKRLEFDESVMIGDIAISIVNLDGFDIEECSDRFADIGDYEDLANDQLEELAEAVEQQIVANEKVYERAGLYDY